jgi:transcriptional regulator with XRE-family HTH domain
MLYSEQIRAARALLSWRQEDLARAARVGLATIQRIEQSGGPFLGNVSTQLRIQQAFERAGIRIIDADAEGGIGVRLELAKTKKKGQRPGK